MHRQIGALYSQGVAEIVVVTGFSTGAVERSLDTLPKGINVRVVFNPFFHVADNLASCWMARDEMAEEFILLNGDTLFEPEICNRLLNVAESPITMAIDRKESYDTDDMKVCLDGNRLVEVGKDLESSKVHGESIGMMVFRGEGPEHFRSILEQTMRTPNSLSWWYLKTIGVLAERGLVATHSIEGLKWGEVDFQHDLERVRALFGNAPTVASVARSAEAKFVS